MAPVAGSARKHLFLALAVATIAAGHAAAAGPHAAGSVEAGEAPDSSARSGREAVGPAGRDCTRVAHLGASQTRVLRRRGLTARVPACRRSVRLRLTGWLVRAGGRPIRITKGLTVKPRDRRSRRVKLKLIRSGARQVRRCEEHEVLVKARPVGSGRKRTGKRRAPLILDRSECAAQPDRPNVLLIVTDDQRANGTMSVMDETRSQFAARGTEFTRAMATTPLCCPSRASIFSGLYPHNHGVIRNGGKEFDPTRTWQKELHDAGYFTGLFGKYFVSIAAGGAPFFDRRASVDPESPSDPDLVASHANGFLTEAESRDDTPWALVLTTSAPHAPFNAVPDTPEPLPPWQPSGSFGEDDLSDKHPAVATEAARFVPRGPGYVHSVRDGQLTELQAADEMVGQVMRTVERYGEREETLAIFTSDNGYMWADHGLYHKLWPYRESIDVPLYVSWPGHFAEGASDDRLAANIDIAPTILDATGVEPAYTLDGRSLLTGPERPWLLLEGPLDVSGRVPRWRALIDDRRHYIEWEDGLVEHYDLRTDPWELVASNAPDPAIAARLDAASSCSGPVCP